MPRRELTAAEAAYVRAHSRTDSTWAMSKALGIPWDTLAKRMREMGLDPAPDDPSWSAEDVHRLRELAGKGWSALEIAEALGRTENAVYIRARRSGIAFRTPNRKWTLEEKDTVRREWGYVQVSTIAKHVHRTVDAVCQQAHKMHLDAVYSLSEDLPLSGFCANTGISRDRICRHLVFRHGFPLVSRKYGKRKFYYYVDREKILPWMERHQDLFDGSKVAEDYFIPEPEWLSEKRRADRADPTRMDQAARYGYWREDELKYALDLARIGLSYAEIGSRLGRTPNAVAEKLRAEGGSYLAKAWWTLDEFKYVRAHWREMDDKAMGKALKRPAGGVQSQRLAMGLYRVGDLDESQRLFVRLNHADMSDGKMASALGAKVQAVAVARRSMGLYRPGEWSDADSAYVMDHWESMSDAEMGTALGHTESRVRHRRRTLGLLRAERDG